jgi:hypothetical protein
MTLKNQTSQGHAKKKMVHMFIICESYIKIRGGDRNSHADSVDEIIILNYIACILLYILDTQGYYG